MTRYNVTEAAEIALHWPTGTPLPSTPSSPSSPHAPSRPFKSP
jgi:hypothetical protein